MARSSSLRQGMSAFLFIKPLKCTSFWIQAQLPALPLNPLSQLIKGPHEAGLTRPSSEEAVAYAWQGQLWCFAQSSTIAEITASPVTSQLHGSPAE